MLEREFGGDHMPDKYTDLASLSVCLLQGLCAEMEPGALSMSNLRAMTVRGHRNATRTVLLRIIEFGTGLTPEHRVTGDMRVWQNLFAFLRERSFERSRRCRELLFPPKWEAMGLYKIIEMDDVVCVAHLQHSQPRSVPDGSGWTWRDLDGPRWT